MELFMENLKYQTGLKRFGAAIVDAIVFIPLVFVDRLFSSDITVRLIWTVFVVFLSLFYSIFLHYKYGQTIGKWVTRVKVVDIEEKKGLSLKQSFIRDSFNVICEVLALAYLCLLINQSYSLGDAFYKYRDFANKPEAIWIILELI